MADKVAVIARRDLLTAMRYHAGFWSHIIATLAEIAGFYFLARAVGRDYRPDGVSYFPFLLVGTSLYGFLLTGTNAFLDSVREAQWSGTMEVLMTTSTPGPVIVLLTAISAYGGRILHLLLYLGLGFLLFRAPLEPQTITEFLKWKNRMVEYNGGSYPAELLPTELEDNPHLGTSPQLSSRTNRMKPLIGLSSEQGNLSGDSKRVFQEG